MTVQEIYDRGIKDLPAHEQLRLASLILDQLTRSETGSGQELSDEIRQNTPLNAVLLNAAATHGPPEAWWDADDDPTVPSDGQ